MKKRIIIFHMIVLLIVVSLNNGLAATQADETFSYATISLYTYEAASFSAAVKATAGFIRIDSCWLQKWNGTKWQYYCWLPAPSSIEYNTIGYGAYMDYASYIPNDGGTYRIGAYFNADNHTIRRFSNSRTFN